MATINKRTSACLSPLEQQILMHSYDEFEHVVERGKKKQKNHHAAVAKRESWRGRKLLMSKCASLDDVCYLIRHLIRPTRKQLEWN